MIVVGNETPKQGKSNPTFQRVVDECLQLELRPTETMLVQDACNVFPNNTVELLSSDAVNGAIIVEAWLRALDTNWEHSDRGGVFVMSLFRAFFDPSHRLGLEIDRLLKLRTSKSGAHFSRQGSWFEATRRLAGTLFHLGRIGEPTPQKQKWLSRVLELSNYTLANDPSARRPTNFIRCAGHRGVSCVLLARTATDPATYYDEAAECLRWTRELGDKTLENGQYLAESYLHLLELRKDQTCLAKAEAVLGEVHKNPKVGRRAFTLSGEVYIQKGFASLIAEQPDKAFQHFTEAEAHLTKALAMPADPTTDDAYVLRDRGLSRYMLFTTANRLGKEPFLEKLDGAIADLETREPDGKLVGCGGTTLPNVLFIRAWLFRNASDLPKTHDFLSRAYQAALKAPGGEELIRSIHVTQCALKVEAQVASENATGIFKACQNLLSFRSTGRVPFAPLAHAARTVIKLDPALGDKLAADVVDEADSVLAKGDLELGAKQFTASHAGTLALHLAKQSNSPEDYLRAYAFYRVVLSERTPDIAPEALGLAGDTALRVAKLYLSRGNDDEAESFLQDAVAHYSDAITAATNPASKKSGAFKEREAFSKLGECALRLNALNGDLTLLDKAIESFEQSKKLGNDSGELVGLLGDAFYRRGRSRTDVVDLRHCIECKAAARKGGEPKRENLSVSARVHFQIGDLTGETAEYRQGITLLGQTLRVAPDWPWPLFQMEEVARILPQPVREEIVSKMSDEDLPSKLGTAFKIADSNTFFDAAIACVLRNKEFERLRLGGQNYVYVVDDPHRLLSESYVFKHTHKANAERDQQTILQFRKFLNAHNAPEYFGLPEPLRITPLGETNAVYLMRKSNGVQLGRLVIRAVTGSGQNPKPYFLEALRFLAFYHAWNGRIHGDSIRHVASALFKGCIPFGLANRLAAEFPSDWPLVRKKDAHPENWLRESSGRITMLDFDASRPCPLFLDTVQLIDDYPLIATDTSGWQERLEMVRGYLQQLEELEFAHGTSAQTVERAYAALVVFRCAFGLRQQRQAHHGALERDSMSALKAISLRIEHYRKLLELLNRHATSAAVREIAATVLEEALPKKQTKRKPIASLDAQAPEAFS
jgi:tetratricopeptide (TPR) repeat protein